MKREGEPRKKAREAARPVIEDHLRELMRATSGQGGQVLMGLTEGELAAVHALADAGSLIAKAVVNPPVAPPASTGVGVPAGPGQPRDTGSLVARAASSRRHSTLGARHSRSPPDADASLLTTALLGDSHSSEAWRAGSTSREAAASSRCTRAQSVACATSAVIPS